jgi:hypothetical protein
MQAVEDPHFANLAAMSTSTSDIITDGLSAEDVEELQELKADLAQDVEQVRSHTHSSSNAAFFKQLQAFVQFNKPVQHAIASLGSDSSAACSCM